MKKVIQFILNEQAVCIETDPAGRLLDTIRQLYTNRQKYIDAMAGNGHVDSIRKITDLIEECARS